LKSLDYLRFLERDPRLNPAKATPVPLTHLTGRIIRLDHFGYGHSTTMEMTKMTEVQQVEATQRDRAQTTKEREAAIKYDAAVAEGKRLVKVLDSNTMQLGELADRVKAAYGKGKLAQFARDIGINAATLSRWRSVYRKWKGIEAPEPISATVLKTIQDHPKRAEIIKANPNLTVREARTHMRDYRLAHPEKQQEWQVRDTRGWLGHAVKHAKDAIQYGHPAAHCLDPAILRLALDNPEQAEATLRAGGGALITLADEIKRALASPTPPPMFEAKPNDATD
jgi:transposase-like protein